MKYIFKTLICAAVVTSFFLSSCGNNDPVGCNWATELQAESDALGVAATAYGNNPTPANCQAFKDAYQDYLNDADNYVDCAYTAGQGVELQNSIDQAQASLDALQC